jgi:uncharacterized tellurite resistance protein B-like protein
MIDLLKRFFAKTESESTDTHGKDTGHDVRVATCALLIEIARIDEKFTDAELETILRILKEKYGLSQENADAVMQEADKELEESVDLWQFARLINEHYTPDEKIEIIEILWQIVFVDGKMDKYENYLMHRLGNLLRLSHKQLMDAKVKILRSS